MKATTGYTGIFLISLALTGMADLSHAALDSGLVQDIPGSLTKDLTDTSMPGAALVQNAALQSQPDFTGLWSLDVDASDNPRERLKEVMQARSQRKAGKMGRGIRGGRHGSSGRMGERSTELSRESLSLVIAAEQIDIHHEEPMLLITDENDRRRRLFTDFRGSSVSASGGFQQRVSVAGWEGPVLVMEMTLNSGARLIQRYQLDAKSDQLEIASVANLPEGQAVSYRLVYKRVKSGLEDRNQEQ